MDAVRYVANPIAIEGPFVFEVIHGTHAVWPQVFVKAEIYPIAPICIKPLWQLPIW